MRTRAVRDGDEWVINGSKLYITNGTQADWLCLLARTSDEGGYRGMSQIVFPTDTPGFSVSRKLDKLGNRSLRHRRAVLRRRPGAGGQHHRRDRPGLPAADAAVPERADDRRLQRPSGPCARALERDRGRTSSQRQAFGQPLMANQYLQFTLAELAAELDLLRHYNYACAEAYMRGEDTTRFATIAKLKAGRLQRQVADTCLQFHGGIGYMEETWVSRFFRDGRLLSIGGGADEVMLRVLAEPRRLHGLSRWSPSPSVCADLAAEHAALDAGWPRVDRRAGPPDPGRRVGGPRPDQPPGLLRPAPPCSP